MLFDYWLFEERFAPPLSVRGEGQIYTSGVEMCVEVTEVDGAIKDG